MARPKTSVLWRHWGTDGSMTMGGALPKRTSIWFLLLAGCLLCFHGDLVTSASSQYANERDVPQGQPPADWIQAWHSDVAPADGAGRPKIYGQEDRMEDYEFQDASATVGRNIPEYEQAEMRLEFDEYDINKDGQDSPRER
eukprot:GHVT01033063.1.p1 GENE.GHVT01033063.1~~GHVT01033063.1.p1  ORF type:complete len:141 (+),score=7.25 GHVT01033063.1:443-865(+)